MDALRSDRATLSRRAALTLAGGAAAGVALTWHGNASARAAQLAKGANVYFGWVLGSPNIIAVAIHADPANDAGDREIRAYVCDGLGQPKGIALWFKGTVEADKEVAFSAPKSGEWLVVDFLSPELAAGTFTDQEGVVRRYASFRAIDGAGIYDVTLDADLRYAGTSTDGSVLAAQATEDGKVRGAITTADGTEIAFLINVLARASEETLNARGLPQSFRNYADVSIIPDTYVAVISPAGAFWLGRSGDVRGGDGGLNIIGLDACERI